MNLYKNGNECKPNWALLLSPPRKFRWFYVISNQVLLSGVFVNPCSVYSSPASINSRLYNLSKWLPTSLFTITHFLSALPVLTAILFISLFINATALVLVSYFTTHFGRLPRSILLYFPSLLSRIHLLRCFRLVFLYLLFLYYLLACFWLLITLHEMLIAQSCLVSWTAVGILAQHLSRTRLNRNKYTNIVVLYKNAVSWHNR